MPIFVFFIVIGRFYMNERQRKPPLTKELLEYMDREFPDRLPQKRNITSEEVAFLQGQRSVVEFLIQLFEQEL